MESLGRWLVTSTWTQEQRQQAAPPHLTGITAAALRDFVEDRFGSECVQRVVAQHLVPALQAAWEARLTAADMVQEEAYLQVFSALAQWARMDLYTLLFEFGQHLIMYLADNAGYGRSIHRVAATFPDFCRGLTQFMNQLFESMGNTKNVMPQMAVKDETADSFTLLLIGSQLPERPPVLWGVLDRIASHVFDLQITIQPLQSPQPSCQEPQPSPGTGSAQVLSETIQAIRIRMTSLSGAPCWRPLRQHSGACDSVGPSGTLGPRPEEFYSLFPFHFVMDRRFRLLQAGAGMRKVLPEMVPGTQVNELLTILHPTVRWNIELLDLVLENTMTAKVVFESFNGLLHLKGGLYRIRPMQQHAGAEGAAGLAASQDDVLLFLGSPNCNSFDSMASHHLYLSDLPPHDMTADFVLMADHRKAKMVALERTAESLVEERRCNTELKATLAEALAAQVDAAGVVSSNSAIDVTVKLLDAMVMQEEVSVHQVLFVRDALLRAGANLWRPINFDSRNIDKDEEVNAALGTLLGTARDESDAVEADEPASISVRNSRSAENFLSDPEGLVGDLDDEPQPEFKAKLNDSHRCLNRNLSSPTLYDNDANAAVRPSAPVALSAAGREACSSGATAIRLLLEPTTELSEVLQEVDNWQFDMFKLEQASNGHCLSLLAYHLFKRMDMIRQLHLSEMKLIRYLVRIEQGYQQTPYHSRIHAADVLRTMHVLLTRGGVMDLVSAAAKQQAQIGHGQAPHGSGSHAVHTANGHEIGEFVLASAPFKTLMCYLAATIHDYEHKGLTNDYLVRTGNELALRYNDISPLENHHLSAALTLLREDQYAFMPNASKKMTERVRKHVIELVLSTDMKQHFAMVGLFNSKAGQDRSERESTPRASSASNQRLSGGRNPRKSMEVKSRMRRESSLYASDSDNLTSTPSWDAETRLLMLKMALKCADLGHLSSSLEVHSEWVRLLEEEMFLQGDKERALGQPISPLMDRNKAGVTKSQVGFFSVVALPLFSAFSQVFPAAEGLVANVRANCNHWREVEEAGKHSQ